MNSTIRADDAGSAVGAECARGPVVRSRASVRWALAGLSLATLLSSLGTSVANVALPSLVRVFQAPFPLVQWVVVAYLLTMTTAVVIAGRLGDRFGRRRVLLAGLLVFIGASVACGVALGLGPLIAARGAQGLGAAVMIALSMALARETVPVGSLGRAVGLLGTMSALGTALGPSLGGWLIASIGWRAIFLVNAALGIATYLLVARHVAPPTRTRGESPESGFDLAGAFLLTLTLSAYTVAWTLGRGNFGLRNVLLLAVAVGGAWAFVRVERAADYPLVQLALFRDRRLVARFGLGAVVSAVVMATLVVGPFHLSRALGLGPAVVGLVMSMGPVVAALTALPAGRLSDRFGADRMIELGLWGMAAGCAAFAMLPVSMGVVGYVLPLVLTTGSYALFQSANQSAVMSTAGEGQAGVVSALLNLSRNLGLVTGASLLGTVFAMAAQTHEILAAKPEAVDAGMRMTFAVAAVWVGVALAIARWSGRPEVQREGGGR